MNKDTIGMVGIDVPIPVPRTYHVFGAARGSQCSAISTSTGRTFKFYTRTKTMTARSPSGIKEGGELNFKAMD